MFTKTAEYYDALYHFKDYEKACALLDSWVQKMTPGASSLLDVACGTGKHIQFLSRKYQTEGLDLNPELLGVAKSRCPDVKFYEGDMTDFDLAKKYDVVTCLFSSIGYVCTVERLNNALRCMANHLKPGGLLLIEPWIYPGKYWLDKITANFYDGKDMKISWMYTSKIRRNNSVFDIRYMVGTPAGVETFEESHVMGLWTDEQYRDSFANAGIEPSYDAEGFFGRGLYYGLKK